MGENMKIPKSSQILTRVFMGKDLITLASKLQGKPAEELTTENVEDAIHFIVVNITKKYEDSPASAERFLKRLSDSIRVFESMELAKIATEELNSTSNEEVDSNGDTTVS